MYLSSALTTPIMAPPAINPEAMSVPLSLRALLVALSFDLELMSQAMKPPTKSGMFKAKGINMPKEKARAGMPILSNKMANMVL